MKPAACLRWPLCGARSALGARADGADGAGGADGESANELATII